MIAVVIILSALIFILCAFTISFLMRCIREHDDIIHGCNNFECRIKKLEHSITFRDRIKEMERKKSTDEP